MDDGDQRWGEGEGGYGGGPASGHGDGDYGSMGKRRTTTRVRTRGLKTEWSRPALAWLIAQCMILQVWWLCSKASVKRRLGIRWKLWLRDKAILARARMIEVMLMVGRSWVQYGVRLERVFVEI